MKRTIAFLIAFSLILSACDDGKKSLKPASERQSLDGSWSFKSAGASEWMAATVPGSAHTDLMANGVIPDPYFSCNEDSVQWVSERVWEYRKTFDANRLSQEYGSLTLVFEGVDTHAEIFLNETLLPAETATGRCDNMFRKWEFDVTKMLREGDNELLVRFFPPVAYNDAEAAKLDYTLPDERVFSRKAPYQFGWDWGPRLITCGLWKPAYLQGWNRFKIENLHIVQHQLTDDFAEIEAVVEVYAAEEGAAALELFLDGAKQAETLNVSLKKGTNVIRKNLRIDAPERWNPVGLGAQKLYRLAVELYDKEYSASAEERFGLRTIALVRERDEIGESFEFHVNGKPVFMKGANYIPQDNFPHRATRDRYERLLSAAKDANMNMLRVWGGGVYEEDTFYQICDSLGILVWQDFIFACALYPGDDAFLSTVEQEAVEQIKRLRNHPSIALWCGNNEVKNGWEDWGWQKDYTPAQQTEIWRANRTIFEEMFPRLVAELSPGTSYHFTSPLWGWGHPECVTEGNSHYWGVWWGEQPFSVWEEKTGRFMAEFGFQSLPNYSTIETFTTPDERHLTSPAMRTHQKHARGYHLIHSYMQEDFPVPQRFFDYVYVSHLTQAHGIGQALEIHRRRKPYCMGTLYWQINDCWPVASWSSMDSDYQPKALHFAAKKAFEPLILTTFVDEQEIALYAVSDLQRDISGRAIVEWMDFHGNVLDKKEIPLNIPENSSIKFFAFPKETFAGKERNTLLLIRFDDNAGRQAEKIHYFVPPKDLQLPDYQLQWDVAAITDSEFQLTFSSGALVKNLYIHGEKVRNSQFSDNYFDLAPNVPKTIVFKTEKPVNIEEVENKLKVISLKDVK